MSILTEYKEKCGFEIYGFCLMSNHIHLLLKTGAEPLESIFKKNGQQICLIERILKESRNKE